MLRTPSALLRIVALSALVAMASFAPGVRADYQAGMLAYEQGLFVEAFEAFLPEAKQGNADAQYRLGILYEHGRGVDQDLAQAAEWYRKAADQEHARARTNLGSLYYHGKGVEQNRAEAARWYRLAAGQGRAVAQTNLGQMYEKGLGVEADPNQAAAFYRLAADQGHAEAQYALGRLYEAGNGVKQEDRRAARLYLKAAKQEHPDAQHALAQFYAQGRGVKQNATRASEWFRAAAANGHAEAQHNLDSFYASRGTLTDIPAATPDAPAQATPPAPPKSVPPTPAPAPKPSSPAPIRTDAETPEPAGTNTSKPITAAPVPQATADMDALSADELYQQARRYAQGMGVPRDERAALRWYRQAAERGHELAGYRLALLYFRGRGAEKPDFMQAHLWFSISAERGVGDAGDWRDRVERKLTKRQRAESQRLLAEHLGNDGS